MTTQSGTWIDMTRQRRSGGLPPLLATVAAALERRAQRAHLATLDARLLRDIGLSAQDALAEARQPFWRR